MSANIYRCTPRQVRRFTIDVIQAGLVPYIQSSPGMGKSSIVRSIAQEYALDLIDHRLSTSAPEDLSGLPRFDENGYAYFAPFADIFPLANRNLPVILDENGKVIGKKNGWILFFDEFGSASKAVQAAAYKTILDRMVGQHHLHPDVAMIAAGNLATDRAIVNPISTAMQSRLIHLEMELSHEEWMEDVAIAQKYDPRITAFLNMYPGKLMDFRPDHQDKTFCCPRTWSFVNSLIYGKEVKDEHATLLAGAITSGTAAEFVQFTKVFATLVSLDDILADPKGCMVPQDNATKWAIVSHLLEKVDNFNLGKLMEYISRFDLSFRILFFRAVLIRDPALRTHPAFISSMVEMSRYLNLAA